MPDAGQIDDIIPAKNLLAISSHVVHGSVGNDAIQFPLNLRNWNVDCIYTTNLSAHPGHGSFTGVKVDSKIVKDLFNGLKDSSLDDEYQAIIIGYIGSESILKTVWNDILLKCLNKDIIVVMDPVMGDNGKVYVDSKIVDSYLQLLNKNEIKIDLLTPNQFEMEILSGVKINSWNTIRNALDEFRLKYFNIKNIVITSVIIDKEMFCVGANECKIFYYKVTEVDAIFSGSGDLFLGILTDEYVKNDNDLIQSLGKTITVVEKVLNLSYNLVKTKSTPVETINGKFYIPDLKLIESKNVLLSESKPPKALFLE